MRRAEIIFDGEVQGVGFRYYVRRVARRLKLVGYVENLADGRVRVVCEGNEQSIEELVKQLKNALPPIKV
ncbi:MAG: acylphosphatase, partial [Aigarchaeota archaeon]|nr:acylphosphatase [Candidatus Pelearchaeum maunauluense]